MTTRRDRLVVACVASTALCMWLAAAPLVLQHHVQMGACP